MCLPEKDGDRRLTLTAAVTQRFHTEEAIFGRYHLVAGAGEFRIYPTVDARGPYQLLDIVNYVQILKLHHLFIRASYRFFMNNAVKPNNEGRICIFIHIYAFINSKDMIATHLTSIMYSNKIQTQINAQIHAHFFLHVPWYI